jgi:hypothetical protein
MALQGLVQVWGSGDSARVRPFGPLLALTESLQVANDTARQRRGGPRTGTCRSAHQLQLPLSRLSLSPCPPFCWTTDNCP